MFLYRKGSIQASLIKVLLKGYLELPLTAVLLAKLPLI